MSQSQTAAALCGKCTWSRQDVSGLCRLAWSTLIDVYEFMLTLTAFCRNVAFYSNMTDGQLRSFYCQLVSYSPAKVVALNALAAKYNAVDNNGRLDSDAYVTPGELISVVSLSLGNAVQRYLVDRCLASCSWRSYEHMVLTCFSATESVRASVLRYTAIMRAHAHSRVCTPSNKVEDLCPRVCSFISRRTTYISVHVQFHSRWVGLRVRRSIINVNKGFPYNTCVSGLL